MIIVTNLEGKTLPITKVDALARTRGTNGDYEISFTIRGKDNRKEALDLIKHESIIQLPDGNKFRIKILDKQMVGDSVEFEGTAIHVFYDAIDEYQYDIIEKEKVLSLSEAISHAFEPTDLTFAVVDEFPKYSFENFGDDNPIALFKKAQEKFGFEFTIDNNKHLRFYNRVGANNGVQMRWKHNIETIKQTDNTQNLSTYIKGYGKPMEDNEGNVIEGEYVVTDDYTSPNADKYGIRHATPYYNEKITDINTLQRYLMAQVNDEPEMTFEITYTQLMKNVTRGTNVSLGDSIHLIHEPMGLYFETRVLEMTDYPLHPSMEPIYVISSQPLNKLDKQSISAIDKNSKDKKIKEIKSSQDRAEGRIEKAQQAVMEVENAMTDLEVDLEHLENVVLPEIVDTVDAVKIPQDVEPPFPIPISKLWWDTSQNPPRLMRYDGEKWVFLAPTEDEIDALMQQMRDEAIQEGKTYSDAEIQATRQAIINQLDKEIGDVNSSISDLNDIKDDLVNRVDTAQSNIESNETAINQLSNEIELRVTKEEFENLEIGGRNLIYDTDKIKESELWEFVNVNGDHLNGNAFNFKESGDSYFKYSYNNSSIEVRKDYIMSFGMSLRSNLEIEVWAEHIYNWYNPDKGVTETLTDVLFHYVVDSSYYNEKTGRYVLPVSFDFKSNGTFLYIGYKGNNIPSSKRLTTYLNTARITNYNTFNPKVESGSKATDWSPAPEDAQEQIDEATERITKAETNITLNSEALELKAEKSELTNYVDKQTYNNKIGQLDVSINDITGRVESTEVDFNDFKTGDYNTFKQQYGEFKLEMDNFTTKVGELSSIDGTLVDSFSEVRQEVGLIESTVSDLRVEVDDLENNMTAVQTTIKQLPDEIDLSVKEGIDLLEIGGTNLVLDSEKEKTPNNTFSAWYLSERFFSEYDTSDDFIISFDAKADTKDEILRVYTTSGNIRTQGLVPLTTEWKRYEVVADFSGIEFERIAFHTGGIEGATNFKGYIRKVKIEKGKKATDWSPAPEDQVNKTNVLSSINLSTEGVKIQGNKIDIKGVAEFMNARPNLLPMHPTNWEQGYISIADGSDGDREWAVRTSDFIAIEPNAEYTINNLSDASIFIREYEEENYVNNHPYLLGAGNSRTFTTGANSRYIRFYFNDNSLDKMDVSEIGSRYKATLVKGDTPLSWEDAKTTIINGGRIVTNNITANQLNVDNIFGNSAVIDKIQADIVRTSELDATQITTGTLDAAKANLINVSASSITTGTLDGLKARIRNIDASEINSGTLNAINITGSIISGGRLQALNNNTNFNLNTGQLTIGNGADIEFEHYGNRLYYNIKDTEGSRLTRSAGMGVGRSINDRFPYAFLGTSTGTRPHPRDDEYFVGFIANTNARITVDGIGNSSVGDVFQVRDNAVSYNKGFEFDLRGSNNFRMRPISSGSYSYWLGASDNQFSGVYTAQLRTSNGFFTFRNSSSSYSSQGFRMDTTYGGDDQLYFRGIHSDDYHSLGRPGGWRFRHVYLRYQPDVSSDERLKTGIKEIDNAYEIINAIEPIQYRYKLSNKDLELKNSGNMPRGLNVNQYGFSAQQVKKVLDDLGIESQSLVNLGEDNYYGMQTTQVIPLLVKAFQDEKQRNDDLESRINQLEQQMEQLLA